MCFLKQLPFSFFLVLHRPFHRLFRFPAGSSPCSWHLGLTFLLSCGNTPSPTPEQRRANRVPAATAFHLLHPPEGQVFDSSTLRFPLLSDALTLSPSWRSRETDRRFPGYFAGTRHGQVWYYTPILCFSPGLASGRFLERDLLGCLLNVWENIWNSYSKMFYFSTSLAFVILVLQIQVNWHPFIYRMCSNYFKSLNRM